MVLLLTSCSALERPDHRPGAAAQGQGRRPVQHVRRRRLVLARRQRRRREEPRPADHHLRPGLGRLHHRARPAAQADLGRPAPSAPTSRRSTRGRRQRDPRQPSGRRPDGRGRAGRGRPAPAHPVLVRQRARDAAVVLRRRAPCRRPGTARAAASRPGRTRTTRRRRPRPSPTRRTWPTCASAATPRTARRSWPRRWPSSAQQVAAPRSRGQRRPQLAAAGARRPPRPAATASRRVRAPRRRAPARRPAPDSAIATLGLAAPATTNHTSRAALSAGKPSEMRVGGGFGQPWTPTTRPVVVGGRRLGEDRRGVPLRAHPEQQHVEGRHVVVGGRRPTELVGVARRGGVGVVAVRAARGAHRVDPRRVEVERVEQRLAGLPVVALAVVGGHEALVAPPHVDAPPVDGGPGGGAAHGRERGDADAATRQHDRGGAAQRLGVDEPGQQPGRDGLGEHVGVAWTTTTGSALALGAVCGRERGVGVGGLGRVVPHVRAGRRPVGRPGTPVAEDSDRA